MVPLTTCIARYFSVLTMLLTSLVIVSLRNIIVCIVYGMRLHVSFKLPCAFIFSFNGVNVIFIIALYQLQKLKACVLIKMTYSNLVEETFL